MSHSKQRSPRKVDPLDQFDRGRWAGCKPPGRRFFAWTKYAIFGPLAARRFPETLVGGARVCDAVARMRVLLKVSEVAEIWGMSRGTIYKLVACGALPVIRVGPHHAIRIQRAALDACVSENNAREWRMPQVQQAQKSKGGRPVTRRVTPQQITELCQRDMDLAQVQETRRRLAQVARERLQGGSDADSHAR